MLRAAQTASYYVLNGANDGIHDDRLTAGENFACGQGTALKAYVAWCMSRDHARTMIGDWAYTGGACFMADINENGGAYPIWIQIFDNRTYEEERWNVAGDTIIQNTEDGIPDKNFYESALEQCDYNKDGKLGENEAVFGMNMDFSNKGIENIQGIQYFTGMPHMDFSGNKIKDLTPFAELAKVEYFGNIDFRDNQISDISMLENVDVESLNLSNNQISDLEVLQKMKSCKAIDLGGNRITDISSVKGSQISSIGLSRNGLTSVESLAGSSYGQLDLSSLKDSGFATRMAVYFLEAEKYSEGINDVETKAGCPYAVCDLAFKNGRLRTDYTGVAVATSDGVNGVIERPIYVRNGIADYSFEGGKYCPNYTGVAESFGNRMDYYVENGNINTERNEAYMEEVDGYLYIYYVKNGVVTGSKKEKLFH